MAGAMGQSVDQSAPTSTIRNTSAAIAVLILALAPQIFEFAWSVAALIFRFSAGRNPAQVLFDHVFALSWAIPTLLFGPFEANSKVALSSDVLLALIYSYPLFALAVLTFFAKPRAPQDYFGGIILIAIALFALWASSDLQGMHGFSFGAGTAPRMFAGLLVALGAGITLVGLLTDGIPLAHYAWRGPLFVSLSILSFAVTIRPLGLVISAFATFLISALGTHETRWKETIIVGIALTAFCSFLFPYGLGLPMQLWPRFLIQ
jgi:putative tricarboxylic transport membrane protein